MRRLQETAKSPHSCSVILSAKEYGARPSAQQTAPVKGDHQKQPTPHLWIATRRYIVNNIGDNTSLCLTQFERGNSSGRTWFHQTRVRWYRRSLLAKWKALGTSRKQPNTGVPWWTWHVTWKCVLRRPVHSAVVILNVQCCNSHYAESHDL